MPKHAKSGYPASLETDAMSGSDEGMLTISILTRLELIAAEADHTIRRTRMSVQHRRRYTRDL